jgi:hypothetical protein
MTRRIRKAVFPVAGLGTRFLPATKSIPKDAAPHRAAIFLTPPQARSNFAALICRGLNHHQAVGCMRP